MKTRIYAAPAVKGLRKAYFSNENERKLGYFDF